MELKKLKKIHIVFCGTVFLFCASLVCDAAMTSENYKINADVIGQGGELGTSENYKLTDTVGEPVIGMGTGGIYKTGAGFWYMIGTSISLEIDSSPVDLGTLTPGTPVTGDSTLSVITDAWNGYELYINDNHNLLHSDASTTVPDYSCSIDSPCLWTGTGLGFTILSGTNVEAKWGSDPNFKYAEIPISSTKFHDKTGYKSGVDETEVGYKLDVPTTQKSGNYSNIVTYTAMEKL